jgi:hypothetical protein
MKRCTWLLFAAMAMPVAMANAQTPPQEASAGEKVANTEAPEKKRRLKFKSDRPTCVCANPVGEAAIEAAAAERAAAESQPKRSEK